MGSPNTASLDQQLQLAAQLHQKGQTQKAEKKYKALIKKRFDLASTHNLLGILYLQNQQYEKGATHLEKAIQSGNTDPNCIYNKGICELELERYDDAVNSYISCIEQQANHPQAWFNLGIAFAKKGDKDQALEAFARDYELHNRLESLLEISSVYLSQKKFDEAENYAKVILDQHPNNEQAIYNLCNSRLNRLGDMEIPDLTIAEQALKLGQVLTKLTPDSDKGYSICADALQQIGEIDLALDYYKKAVEQAPNNAKLHANIGVIELGKGNFSEGWKGVGWREQYGQVLYGMDAQSFDLCRAPVWQGQRQEGKHLLVSSEQGIGDQILQAQLVQELLAEGMQVTMTCNPKMQALFQRSLPQAHIIANNENLSEEQLDKINYKVKMLELCEHMRPSIEHFKPKDSYLNPDPVLVEHFKQKYKAFDGKLKVGISWKSNSVSCGDKKTTDISHWYPLLNLPNVQFFSIQYGDVSDDVTKALNEAGQSIYVDDEFNPFDDIEKATAQIAAMDLVITISNAAAHLAGAIGTPCWVILHTMPLWHWFRDRDDSLWYQNMVLHRQPQAMGWKPVFEQLQFALQQHIKKNM